MQSAYPRRRPRLGTTPIQPFRRVADNPSWLAVKQLDKTMLLSPPSAIRSGSSTWIEWGRSWLEWILALPSLRFAANLIASLRPTPPTSRPIYMTSSLVPVTYSDVLSLVPQIHSLKNRLKPDLIIHVGVGRDGRLTLEQRGRRWGYKGEDANGQLCEAEAEHQPGQEGRRQGFVDARWAEVVQLGCGEEGERPVEEVRTRVVAQPVLDFVRARGVEHIVESEDAGQSQLNLGSSANEQELTRGLSGLYLCEFITFCSTATARIAAKQTGAQETPVQFVHIPL